MRKFVSFLFIFPIICLATAVAQPIVESIETLQNDLTVVMKSIVGKHPERKGPQVADKWNAEGKLFLSHYNNLNSISEKKSGTTTRSLLEDNFGLRKMRRGNQKSEKDYLPVILSFENHTALQEAINKGFISQTLTENNCTGFLPVAQAEEIAKIDGITKISASLKGKLSNEEARTHTNVTYVQDEYAAHNFDMPYTGEGVVVGIVDQGFDYAHPTFFENPAKPSTYRVKRVWNQVMEGKTQPDSFAYGVEYKTTDEILAAQHDGQTQTFHATHVAGTAAGTGYKGNYRGMAPKTDLVLVSTDMQASHIIDGIKYIQDYARSVNKPCVVNLSLGTVLGGARDGKDPADIMLNHLTGPGNLVVASVGNDGQKMMHAEADLNKDNLIMRGIVPDYNSPGFMLDYFDYNTGSAIAFVLLDRSTGTFHIHGKDTAIIVFLTEEDNIGTQELKYKGNTILSAEAVETESTEDYTKLLIGLEIKQKVPDNCLLLAFFYPYSETSTTHYHTWLLNAEFTDYDLGAAALLGGDNNYTISGRYASADSAIAVTSYNKTTSFPCGNIDFVSERVGARSNFSSIGPRTDGVNKPDIAAPGEMVLSAGSRFVSNYEDCLYSSSTTISGTSYPWMWNMGTSMATPVVTGIVALMLQRNPKLSVNQLRNILKETALRDSYVTAGRASEWGFGKILADKALAKVPLPPESADILISEYVEGSGNNKAIELYNNSDYAVDLSKYSLRKQENGVGDYKNKFVLSGTLAPKGKYVVVHKDAVEELKNLANLLVTSTLAFNGNDAVALFKNEEKIDEVGVFNQTSSWGADVTLRRICGMGPNKTYDAAEWKSFPKDDFSDIGKHCEDGENPQPLEVTAPTFSPVAGEIVSGTEVSLSSSQAETEIYYKKDKGSFSKYTSPLTITQPTTLWAYSQIKKESMVYYSDTVSASYTIKQTPTPPVVATPVFDPVSGTSIEEGTKIEISCATNGAKIYYGLGQDTEPTTLYNSGITINTTTHINAIARLVQNGTTYSSDMAHAVYYISFTATEDAPSANIKIYPNPTGGIVNVDLKENASIAIYTSDGRLLMQREVLAGTSQFNMEQSGVYFFKIMNKNRITTSKVVVK
ncbi:S8 family serine peptidase [bacterium]|nr:S8 family serine peptidase [bacterium]